jgi:hypothetical protein
VHTLTLSFLLTAFGSLSFGQKRSADRQLIDKHGIRLVGKLTVEEIVDS